MIRWGLFAEAYLSSYQLKNYSRDRVRVLMRLDVEGVDLAKEGVHRTDKDFAVS